MRCLLLLLAAAIVPFVFPSRSLSPSPSLSPSLSVHAPSQYHDLIGNGSVAPSSHDPLVVKSWRGGHRRARQQRQSKQNAPHPHPTLSGSPSLRLLQLVGRRGCKRAMKATSHAAAMAALLLMAGSACGVGEGHSDANQKLAAFKAWLTSNGASFHAVSSAATHPRPRCWSNTGCVVLK
jgi:hypothetical protein